MRPRLAAALVLAAVLAPAATARAEPIETVEPMPCQNYAPAVVAVGGQARLVRLHVHLVLDGVAVEEGRAEVAKAQEAYTPLGIQLVPSFQVADLSASTIGELVAQTKALFGGRRPPWAHVVHTITDKQLSGSVAGLADCVGALERPDRAFSASEWSKDAGPEQATGLFRYANAKAFAHEVGHLLGAHHHFTSCPPVASRDFSDPAPCDVMAPDVGLASLSFSTLSAAVVRGNVEAHAALIAAPAPPDGSVAGTPPERYRGAACDVRVFDDPRGDTTIPSRGQAGVDLLDARLTTTRTGRRGRRLEHVLRFNITRMGPEDPATEYVVRFGAAGRFFDLVVRREPPDGIRGEFVPADGGEPLPAIVRAGYGSESWFSAQVPLAQLGFRKQRVGWRTAVASQTGTYSQAARDAAGANAPAFIPSPC